MKIIYVMKDIGRSGGARVVCEHLRHLTNRGYHCELCHLTGSNHWFGDVPFNIMRFSTPESMILYLQGQDSIKVATWWETAQWVVQGGGGFYLVQDIETSYYQNSATKGRVLESYRLGLRHIAENTFQYASLKYALDVDVHRIGIAIDHSIFKPADVRVSNEVLYCYRDHPLKRPELMAGAVDVLRGRGCSFVLVSYGMCNCPFAEANYVEISDENLAKLMQRASIFVSTSAHEGFGLPILEAMACGAAVVTTRAVGNESFCVDNVNCLMGETSEEIADAVSSLLNKDNTALRENSIKTAQNYTWSKVVDALEQIFIQKVGRKK